MTRKFMAIFALLSVSFLSGCATSIAPPKVASAAPKAICAGGIVDGDRALTSYAGCQRVAGDLTLNGISSFAPLNRLEHVGGQLIILGNWAKSLSGLDHLRSVGSIVIDSNSVLDNITALGRLSEAKQVVFRGNPRLASPQGFADVITLDQLVINHSGFVTLAGLENLRQVRCVEISDNKRLISIRGLRYLTLVDELVLEGNARICASLGFFGGLLQPPTYSHVEHNPTLFVSEIAKLRPAASPSEIASRN
jgi:hypothetical protein